MSYKDDKIEWAKSLKDKDSPPLSTEMGIIVELSKKVLELEERIKDLEKVITSRSSSI